MKRLLFAFFQKSIFLVWMTGIFPFFYSYPVSQTLSQNVNIMWQMFFIIFQSCYDLIHSFMPCQSPYLFKARLFVLSLTSFLISLIYPTFDCDSLFRKRGAMSVIIRFRTILIYFPAYSSLFLLTSSSSFSLG